MRIVRAEVEKDHAKRKREKARRSDGKRVTTKASALLTI